MSTVTNTVRAFCKRSLSDQSLLPDSVVPWENTKPIPPLPSKDAYRAWCAHPATDHVFFNMTEGEIPGLPVGAGNKPRRIHGFVADYDTTGITLDELRANLRRCSAQFQPHAFNVTFSGGARAVWLFEEPVFYYNNTVFKKFIKRVIRETKANSFAPGLDDTTDQAGRFFTAGDKWVINHAARPIRSQSLHLWLAEASRNDEFNGHGITIPIDLIAAEVQRRFPNRWTGDFTIGARGVRFWDPSGDANSVVVRETGCQAFTGPEPFLTWERIFGREFVQKYMDDRLGGAVKDLVYDGNYYWRQLPDERWDAMNAQVARRHLNIHYRLSREEDSEDLGSELDRALHRIELTKRVEAAIPFPHNRHTIVTHNGLSYLNTANTKLWPAALDPQQWGENFPWIADFLTGFFADRRNLDHFLAWLHVWLKLAHDGNPRKGQAMFIAGPPGTGKTLLSTQIIGRMVGGCAEATSYLVEGNRFNNDLFERALWTIDDALAGTSRGAHARFSSGLKAVIANPSLRYERKFGGACNAPFLGRLMVTLNEDPNSLSILPDADNSLLDKIMLLRTSSRQAPVAMDAQERMETIEHELQYFVRYILDYQIPESVGQEARFGIKAFHDEALLDEARDVTETSSLMEAIDIWKFEYARVHSSATEWAGTATELVGVLNECAQTSHAARDLSSRRVGRLINQAVSNGASGISRRREGHDWTRVICVKLPTPTQVAEYDQLRRAS